METIDDTIERKVYPIENLVRGLILAFPEVKYVALNPNLTLQNSQNWINEWYAVGFREKPYMTLIEGYYTWVQTSDINSASDENSEFFLHFNSEGFYFKDTLLQTSKNEIMNEEDLCFYINENNEITQFKDEDHLLIADSSNTDEIDEIFDF